MKITDISLKGKTQTQQTMTVVHLSRVLKLTENKMQSYLNIESNDLSLNTISQFRTVLQDINYAFPVTSVAFYISLSNRIEFWYISFAKLQEIGIWKKQ